MRITDPAWPAVQEAARMMLREDVASIMAHCGNLFSKWGILWLHDNSSRW
ncbi:hypothetical protein N9M83_06670 [Candidatus Poseidonia alphae]|nr:hypothetical protein [Candidatus Poseidonia alphae]